MAVVAVQIADLQAAGIILGDADLEPECGNLGSSQGAGNFPKGKAGVGLRGLLGCSKLLLAQSESVLIIHVG